MPWAWMAIIEIAFRSRRSRRPRGRFARGRPNRTAAGNLDLDQVAILRIAHAVAFDQHLLAAPVDRHEARLVLHHPDHAERRATTAVDDLDDAGRIGRTAAVLVGEDLGEHSVVQSGGRRLAPPVSRLADQDSRCRPLVFRPFGGAPDQFSVLVAGGDVEHRDRRQGAGARKRLAALLQEAFVLKVLSRSLSSTRASPFSPKALAISRLDARSGFSAMNSSKTPRGGTAPWMMVGPPEEGALALRLLGPGLSR
jgi:hypothetical protein